VSDDNPTRDEVKAVLEKARAEQGTKAPVGSCVIIVDAGRVCLDSVTMGACRSAALKLRGRNDWNRGGNCEDIWPGA
jgi:hypothetical protein